MSWRAAFPARQVSFSVVPASTKTPADVGAFGFAQGKGRTRFRVRLRPGPPPRGAPDRHQRHRP